MAKRKYKLNFFDIIVLTIILLGAVVIAVAYDNKPYLGSKMVNVQVVVTDQPTIENIKSKLDGSKNLFIDSDHYPVEQVSYELITGADGALRLFIKLRALGDIRQDKSILLGQRIYANQKVILKGDYSATGYITDYSYED